jgi:hypothetical protein
VFLPSPEDTDEDVQNEALISLLTEILEAIKAQVRVKHWRENLP